MEWSADVSGVPYGLAIDLRSVVVLCRVSHDGRDFVGVEAFEHDSGARLWSTELPGSPGAYADEPVFHLHYVYVTLGNRLACLDAATGSVIWEWPDEDSKAVLRNPSVPAAEVVLQTSTRGVKALDVHTGAVIWTFKKTTFYKAQRSGLLVVAPYRTGLHIIDAASGEAVDNFELNDRFAGWQLAVVGSIAVTSGQDASTDHWGVAGTDILTGEAIWRRRQVFTDRLLAWGEMNVMGLDRQGAILLDGRSGKTLWQQNSRAQYGTGQWWTDACNIRLLALSQRATVTIYEPELGRTLGALTANPDSLAYPLDRNRVLVTSADRVQVTNLPSFPSLRLRSYEAADLPDGPLIQLWEHETPPPKSVAISGNTLAVSTGDTVLGYDIRSGALRWTRYGVFASELFCGSDFDFVAVGSSVWVLDARSGTVLAESELTSTLAADVRSHRAPDDELDNRDESNEIDETEPRTPDRWWKAGGLALRGDTPEIDLVVVREGDLVETVATLAAGDYEFARPAIGPSAIALAWRPRTYLKQKVARDRPGGTLVKGGVIVFGRGPVREIADDLAVHERAQHHGVPQEHSGVPDEPIAARVRRIASTTELPPESIVWAWEDINDGSTDARDGRLYLGAREAVHEVDAESGSPIRTYLVSAGPLTITDGRLLVSTTDRLFAFDRLNGSLAWTLPRAHQLRHGRRHLLCQFPDTYGADRVGAFDLDTGSALWEAEGYGAVPKAASVAVGDRSALVGWRVRDKKDQPATEKQIITVYDIESAELVDSFEGPFSGRQCRNLVIFDGAHGSYDLDQQTRGPGFEATPWEVAGTDEILWTGHSSVGLGDLSGPAWQIEVPSAPLPAGNEGPPLAGVVGTDLWILSRNYRGGGKTEWGLVAISEGSVRWSTTMPANGTYRMTAAGRHLILSCHVWSQRLHIAVDPQVLLRT